MDILLLLNNFEEPSPLLTESLLRGAKNPGLCKAFVLLVLLVSCSNSSRLPLWRPSLSRKLRIAFSSGSRKFSELFSFFALARSFELYFALNLNPKDFSEFIYKGFNFYFLGCSLAASFESNLLSRKENL